MTDTPNPSGTNEPETSAEEIVAVMETGIPYTAREIADELGIPRRTANYRLNKLAEDGKVRKIKKHERRVDWMLPAEGGDP